MIDEFCICFLLNCNTYLNFYDVYRYKSKQRYNMKMKGAQGTRKVKSQQRYKRRKARGRLAKENERRIFFENSKCF